MRLLIQRLERYFPARRLKLRLNGGPFDSQRLGLPGEGSVIIRDERFAQGTDFFSRARN